MNILRFSINTKIDEFALDLAEEVVNLSSAEVGKSTKKDSKKLSRANKALTQKIHQFSKENKLGVYKKARIGNKFMWYLREHGFEKEIAKDLTQALIHQLNARWVFLNKS